MEKKAIKLGDGEVKLMSFEEVLDQFNYMLGKFATSAIEKIVFNKPEREEVMQELRIQTWEAFRRYNGQNAFSTYLHYRLQHGVHRATMNLYAKKRTNKKGLVSLNELVGGSDESEGELEKMLGDVDVDIESFEFRQFVSYLEKRLEPSEKIILKVLMDKNDFSVQDLADVLGMSRQGANKKVNRLKEKIARIMCDTGYVAI